MKIVVVHERYREGGGEDRAFESECALLESHGHDLIRWVDDHERIRDIGRVSLAVKSHWNTAGNRRLRAMLRAERPDVVHFHNTFPLIGPAAYRVVRDEGIPVVQTLHNYRLICPNAQLFRDGAPCEDCVGRTVPWPGVLHSCYHHGRAATAVVASTMTLHHALGTYSHEVDRYVALTEFARRKFVEGGLPEEKIRVKPNFLQDDPGTGPPGGEGAVFVGRLSAEKGIANLFEAWSRLDGSIPLDVVGDGPEAARAAAAAEGIPGVRWHGRLPRDEVFTRMRAARLLVFPSEWYEGFPFVILEAFATGLPVLASDLGGMPEIVGDNDAGWLAPPGDAGALAAAVERIFADPAALGRASGRARKAFESRYTAEHGYRGLMEIYSDVTGVDTAGVEDPASAPGAHAG